jgi:hypothetical protein
MRRALLVALTALLAAAPAAHAAKAKTRPVGSKPLSDKAAARHVHRSSFEPRHDNDDENRHMLSASDLRYFRAHSDMVYKDRVTGHFRGTTDEIIQWAAWKHGISEDLLRAVAVQESWWHMSTNGDNGDSFGLFQIRRPFHCCPSFARRSTAFNADYYGAILRSYYDGRQPWLNTVERGQEYKAGDLWGSVGAWFAGRWHTPPAEQYIQAVKAHLKARTWRTRDFVNG